VRPTRSATLIALGFGIIIMALILNFLWGVATRAPSVPDTDVTWSDSQRSAA
jgi:hypothetical protein